jgi:hypothetical protein
VSFRAIATPGSSLDTVSPCSQLEYTAHFGPRRSLQMMTLICAPVKGLPQRAKSVSLVLSG